MGVGGKLLVWVWESFLISLFPCGHFDVHMSGGKLSLYNLRKAGGQCGKMGWGNGGEGSVPQS